MKIEIKKINLMSLVFSSLPVTVFIMSLLVAGIQYFYVPAPQFMVMNASGKLLGTFLFAVLFMFLVLAILLVAACVYNVCTYVLGMRGVSVLIDEGGSEDSDEDSEEAEEQQDN